LLARAAERKPQRKELLAEKGRSFSFFLSMKEYLTTQVMSVDKRLLKNMMRKTSRIRSLKWREQSFVNGE
jgi:hypothetical protein